MSATFDTISDALMRPDPIEALEELQVAGVFKRDMPEIQALVGFGGIGHKDLWAHTKKVVAQTPEKLILRWAALCHDIGKVKTFSTGTGKVSFHHHEIVGARLFKTAALRLGFPEERVVIHDFILFLGHIEAYERDWTDSAVRRLTKTVGDLFPDLLTLSRADITTKHADKRQRILAGIQDLEDRARQLAAEDAILPALPTGLGETLMREMGLSPSRALGDLMKGLTAAVEAGVLPRSGPHDVYLPMARQLWEGSNPKA